ncbi:MAG: flagellar protein FlaG [Candidatus Competibacteraceae bacterium]|nr:flagellar protein FlaG [Candidatus Competibacteraceae bacterium]
MAGPKSLEAESRRPPIRAVELEATVEGLNQYLSQFSAEVRFSVDSRADALVVKVVDASTDEVIRQIPTENTLELMHFYQELQEQSQNNHSSGRTLQERRAIEGLLIYAQV